MCYNALCFYVKHKKHRKKLKKIKHHKHISDSVECKSEVKFDHCDRLTDSISLSAGDDVPVPHKHRTASDVTETFVNNQSELQDRKSHKRKRKHPLYDVFDQQKHCKYQKLECDNVTSVKENIQNVHEEHHDNNGSKKHISNEKLQKQLLSSMLQGIDNSQREEKDGKRKKKKNHKHTSDIAQSVVKFEHCDKLTDSMKLSTGGDVPVLHKHRTASNVTETFVFSQSELQDKKSRKRKRRHCQYDVFDQEKHCISPEKNVQNVCEEHHNDSSSKKHISNKKLQKQLLSGVLQGTDNSQQQEKDRKRKKKKHHKHTSDSVQSVVKFKHCDKLTDPTLNSHGTPCEADCIQLQKHKKMNKSKKVRHNKDVLPHSNLSKDLSGHSSALLPIFSVNVDSGRQNIVSDATASTNKDSDVLLVSDLADASPDEVKYVEGVYKEHKSSKVKHKQPTVNTEAENERAYKCPVVVSEANSSEVSNHSQTKKSSSEQHLNSKDILKLLHAENSLSYLKTKTAVKEAGEKCVVLLYVFISCLCILFQLYFI